MIDQGERGPEGQSTRKESLIKEDIGRRRRRRSLGVRRFFEDQDHQGFLDSCSV
jgi:hypothetical protein